MCLTDVEEGSDEIVTEWKCKKSRLYVVEYSVERKENFHVKGNLIIALIKR